MSRASPSRFLLRVPYFYLELVYRLPLPIQELFLLVTLRRLAVRARRSHKVPFLLPGLRNARRTRCVLTLTN